MKPQAAIKASALLLLIVLASGCRQRGVVWTESRNFPRGVWSCESPATFLPDSASLSGAKVKTAILTLRTANGVPRLPLTLVMEEESLATGDYRCDTITAFLAGASSPGEPKMGISEISDTLNLNLTPEPGWSLTVTPLATPLDGVISLTLTLKENEK
ncbi:MAG: hypothetical protein J1E97_04890 [Muribaculaceae bacterium]|nr:hypothetical protein [Muribaculaceae bacterium]